MGQEELTTLLQLMKSTAACSDNTISSLVLKLAADSLNLDMFKTPAEQNSLMCKDTPASPEIPTSREQTVTLTFTKKELSAMPKTFKKEFRTDGCTARVRRKRSGTRHWCYEIRYRRNGYDIAVSSNDLENAKIKFIEALKYSDKKTKVQSNVPHSFSEFSLYYFEIAIKITFFPLLVPYR